MLLTYKTKQKSTRFSSEGLFRFVRLKIAIIYVKLLVPTIPIFLVVCFLAFASL